MKKLTIAAIAACMAVTMITPALAQDSTITSGPWMMRKSTGDKAYDRLWFIADRTLNAAEKDTLRAMFRETYGGSGLALQQGILRAIDNTSKNNPNYSVWAPSDFAFSNGMSDIQVYDAMCSGLSWTDRGGLYMWEEHATPSQMAVVSKLVQMGGWANSKWIAMNGQ
jgi:hypothetical protein